MSRDPPLAQLHSDWSATCLSTNSAFVSVSPRIRLFLPPSNVSTRLTRWDALGLCRESKYLLRMYRAVLTLSYTDNSFTECDADAAYPPGLYPLTNGSTSTFAQRYTGTYTADGSVGTFTVGQTVTPQTPYSIPASSNCKTYPTVSNGIASLAAAGATGVKTSGASAMTSGASSKASGASASVVSAASGASKAAAAGASSVQSAAGSGASAAAAAGASATKSGAAFAKYQGASYGSIVGGLVSVVAAFAGAGALLL